MTIDWNEMKHYWDAHGDSIVMRRTYSIKTIRAREKEIYENIKGNSYNFFGWAEDFIIPLVLLEKYDH